MHDPTPVPAEEAARLLVSELMPASVGVTGEGAEAMAAALSAAGTMAQAFGPGETPPGGFDLVILAAAPDSVGAAATGPRLAALAALSDRILFIPAHAADVAEAPGMETLIAWFELFAELGYQPVVEFDAGFIAPGAFLLDRAAVAAETELAAFAERISLGGALAASARRVATLEAALREADDVRGLRAELAAREAELEGLRGRVRSLERQVAEGEMARAEAERQRAQDNEGWEALRLWVRRVAADPGRNAPSLLAAGMRALTGAAPRGTGGMLRRLFRRRPAPALARLAREVAIIRASPLFDAAWYVASRPDLAGVGADPALHYLLVGAAEGAAPGPWFDPAAWASEHPEAAASGVNPLVAATLAGEGEPGPRS